MRDWGFLQSIFKQNTLLFHRQFILLSDFQVVGQDLQDFWK